MTFLPGDACRGGTFLGGLGLLAVFFGLGLLPPVAGEVGLATALGFFFSSVFNGASLAGFFILGSGLGGGFVDFVSSVF